MNTLNLSKKSEQAREKASREWQTELALTFVGKTVTFRGNSWNSKSKGHWDTHKIKVSGVDENNSGDPFSPSIVLIDSNGDKFSVHPDYQIDIDLT
jgi:hypothetical protein